MAKILAIDPGPVESGWVLIGEDLRPLECGISENYDVTCIVEDTIVKYMVVEKVAAYGMRVGQEVFDTAFWSGIFWQKGWERISKPEPEKIMPSTLYRRDVKLHICGRANAKDADIKQALIDRFAYGEKNGGKGTKAAPGWFYGFSADIWQAYALGVAFAETVVKKMEGSKNE